MTVNLADAIQFGSLVKILVWLKFWLLAVPFCIVKDVINYYTAEQKQIDGQVSVIIMN